MNNETKVKNKNQNSGITLIALVVTIVVLIILATVSINAVFSENGIIKKAELAKSMHANAIKADEESMNTLLEEYNNAMAEPPAPELPDITPTTPAGTQVKIPADAGWTSTQVTAISDGSGNAIPLPNDFYYLGGDYDTGLVISDKQGDTMDASGTNMGNQFVWIPVSGESDLTRTKFDSNGQPTTGLDTTRYTEPYASGYSTEASEYNTMKAQVLQYGGFYIGRFEAGINSTTLRTSSSTAQTVVSKKGVAPYNYVPWGTSMSDIGTSGATYLAKNLATQEGYTSVTSTLCYGCQWDAMCRYIGDSNRTTPTKSAVELTGNVSTDVSKNIYDLAGNCSEWTMEANTYDIFINRVYRGGNYSNVSSVSFRNANGPSYSHDFDGFRCTLYIK